MILEKCQDPPPTTDTAIPEPRAAHRHLPEIARDRSIVDVAVATLSLALFALWIYTFRYQRSLGEDDLYRLLVGLLDGARSGSGFASAMHYGKGVSFGYIAAMYSFADPRTLQDPQRLIALINSIGFWATIAGSGCFWLSTRILYGVRVATVALIVFAFSPMMLEIGTSGHEVLVSFAFFAAASVLIFLPLRAPAAVFCSMLGSLLLLAALLSRSEIFLAFPFLVLARADLRSFPQFWKSASLRAIGPTLAFAAFLLLKHFYVDHAPGTPAESETFFTRFYSFANLPRGVLVYFAGCGFATTLVGLFAAVRIVRAALAASDHSQTNCRLDFLRFATGPLALILPALLFWIANPLPARHFLLCLAGTALLIGWLVRSLAPISGLVLYPLVLSGLLANQALAALSGPFILQLYPSKLVTIAGQRGMMPRVPLGSSWSFHQAVQAERWRADAFAESIRHTCEAKTLVLTDRQRQVVSHLYVDGTPWIARKIGFHQFRIIVAESGARTIMVLSEHEGWPQDAMAEILADPGLNQYQLVQDPETVSVYDKTSMPSNRRARLGCAP